MHLNGPQNTLPALTVAASTLVFIVEGITTRLLAQPAFTRLAAATSITRLVASALMVYVPYFM